MSSGPLSQAILEGESITNVVYGFESDCSNLNINVIGLPNGVSWEGQANNIVISGQAEDTPGSYVYVVGIIKSEATASGEGPEAFIEGEIIINGNERISCSVSLSLSSGPLSQAILEGESITNVVYGFESDCSNLNINVIGLPNGVSWEGQANNIVISGQAEDTPGSYVYVVGIIKSEATASGEGPEAFIEW